MSEKGHSAFDEHLRNALEGYEVEYNPADWAEMEQSLNIHARKARFSKAVKIGVAGLVAVICAVLLFNYFTSENEIIADNTMPVVKENTIQQPGNVADEPVQVIAESEETTNPAVNTVKTNIHPDEIPEQTENVVANKENPAEDDPLPDNKESPLQKAQPKKLINESIEKDPVEYAKPNANFTADISKTCAHTPIRFHSENEKTKATYLWDFGDGTYSNKPHPVHSYEEAGTHHVTLTVSSTKSNKKATFTLPITVYSNHSADFDYEFGSQNLDPSVQFTDNSFDAIEWKWTFGDKQTSVEQNPKHIFQKQGGYSVQLTIKNSNGCTATMLKTISVLQNYNLFAPKAFSPNGDGLNDNWFPEGLRSDNVMGFTLKIVDPKSSTVVFATSDKNFKWDGRRHNNGMVNSGEIYGWIAKVKHSDGKMREYGGTITVIK